MCGILGIITKKPFATSSILQKLQKMEYRGYDSFGVYDGQILEKTTWKNHCANH